VQASEFIEGRMRRGRNAWLTVARATGTRRTVRARWHLCSAMQGDL
jgi:hypothetical protein